MKNIEIKINKNTRMVNLSKTILGNEGENQQYNLVFSFEDEFVDGQARLEYQNENGEKQWVSLEKSNETYSTPLLSSLTLKGHTNMQLVIDENANTMPVFKSNIFYLYCNESINAVDEAPQGYELWIEQANAKLNEIDNIDVDIEDSVITIYKKDGTTKSENVKGDKGDKGDAGAIKLIVVNELPTENIDESAIYLKPSENPAEENVYDEYVYTNGNWEKLSGGASIDLSDYATKDYVDDAIASSGSANVTEQLYDAVITSTQNWDYSNHSIYGDDLTQWQGIAEGLINGSISNVLVKDIKGAKRIYKVNNIYNKYISLTTGDSYVSSSQSTQFIARTIILNKNKDTNIITGGTYYNQILDLSTYATKTYVDNQVGSINTVLATLTEVSE